MNATKSDRVVRDPVVVRGGHDATLLGSELDMHS